jgi:hypothetical protein
MDADGKPKPKVNSALMQVLAVMRLTYVPGTDERLFEQADQDSLMNEESGGLVDVLGKAAVKLLSPDIGALGKSSAQIPSTSSATE